jgi:hypothetical protein
MDGEIFVLWFHTLHSQTFFFFLQVNVRSIQKRHATIWINYVSVVLSRTPSYDRRMKADICKEHFLHVIFMQNILNMRTIDLAKLAAKVPLNWHLCHTRVHQPAFQKQFQFLLTTCCELLWDGAIWGRSTGNNARDWCQAIMEANTVHSRRYLEMSCTGQCCQIHHAESPRRHSLYVGLYDTADSFVSIFLAP